jgi:hypothetical protein
MFNKRKIAELEAKVDELTSEVQRLVNALEHKPDYPYSMVSLRHCGDYNIPAIVHSRPMIDGNDLMHRFGELYEHLGVKREYQRSCSKLVPATDTVKCDA